ncbi:MAG: hypothetical protein WD066_12520 [Planctomycetaceae bacterium]
MFQCVRLRCDEARRFVWLAIALLVTTAATAIAADEKPAARGPLAELPSRPAEHVEKIRALKPGEWLLLGAPAPDPKWGLARGRAFTSKMAAAGDLGGAFLYGEGVHGFWDRENNRYMDDFWFYDLLAHRWICLYPGSDVKNLTMQLDAKGVEVTADGEPLPIAPLVHGYEMTTYLPGRKRFMFLPVPGSYWRNSVGERRKLWLEDIRGDVQRPRADPRLYDVAAGR